MSPDELLLLKILKALKEVKLEAILVGNAAAALHGVPVMTQDIDFFIRDTELNRKKIKEFAKQLKLSIFKFNESTTETIRVEGEEITVDFVFRMGPRQSFERVRSRSKLVRLDDVYCRVASLEDILIAKSSLGRDKDKAVLKLIEDTIRVKKILKNEK